MRFIEEIKRNIIDWPFIDRYKWIRSNTSIWLVCTPFGVVLRSICHCGSRVYTQLTRFNLKMIIHRLPQSKCLFLSILCFSTYTENKQPIFRFCFPFFRKVFFKFNIEIRKTELLMYRTMFFAMYFVYLFYGVLMPVFIY